MKRPSLKDLLMKASNKGYSIKIEIGTTMDLVPCLQVEVKIETEPKILWADGKPCEQIGEYKYRIERSIHQLIAIPDYPDAFVDVLLQNRLFRELVEGDHD